MLYVTDWGAMARSNVREHSRVGLYRAAVAAAAAMLLLASAVGVASGRAPAATTGDLAADTEAPTVQVAAEQYYMTHYGVSNDVADQRLRIQDAAQSVLDGVIHDLGVGWAGAWFDPNDGGRLKIAVAGLGSPPSGPSVSAAQALLASKGVDAYADFVSAPSSWVDLKSAQAAIDSQLSDLVRAGKISTGLQPRDNAVVINTADDLTAAQSAEIKSVTVPVKIIVSPSNVTNVMPADQSCTMQAGQSSTSELFCDPPLRGGVLMASTDATACTAGFHVRSVTDQKDYILTAGHCVWETASTTWQTRFADGTLHDIGVGHNYVAYTGGDSPAPGDYGVIGVDNPSGWDLTSTSTVVWVGPSATGGTTQNSLYPIYQDGTSSVGLVVCMTSGVLIPQTGYHTDCGEVQALNQTFGDVTGLAKTNLCGRGGSSGSPVYKNDTGYGIIVSGDSSTCLEYYQGLQEAESGMHVSIVP